MSESHDVEFHDPANVVNPEHVSHHIVTPVTYAIVFGALLLGTAITVVAAYIDLGIFNPIVALAIASTKAVIVILFFMHVKGASEKLTGVVVVSAFFFLSILLILSLADYLTRSWR